MDDREKFDTGGKARLQKPANPANLRQSSTKRDMYNTNSSTPLQPHQLPRRGTKTTARGQTGSANSSPWDEAAATSTPEMQLLCDKFAEHPYPIAPVSDQLDVTSIPMSWPSTPDMERHAVPMEDSTHTTDPQHSSEAEHQERSDSENEEMWMEDPTPKDEEHDRNWKLLEEASTSMNKACGNNSSRHTPIGSQDCPKPHTKAMVRRWWEKT
ncbi:uncharacterized protein EI90DRAFT_3177439 [Cantharellus anzutake]|uniref:uncharacterized protein n=1 Tax=Cantharellus anzutake TaxID=1750568 RepID=UPI0019046CDF|nr:uncharacterized protein EI90DRAFT_3177439 [Cantharellus anzutake]KAF8314812.1 hypothetical protein EI90DRAFT_3177439 [Cantharellus anzutake]